MSLALTWMELEILILSEVSQKEKKTNTVRQHLYLESNIWSFSIGFQNPRSNGPYPPLTTIFIIPNREFSHPPPPQSGCLHHPQKSHTLPTCTYIFHHWNNFSIIALLVKLLFKFYLSHQATLIGTNDSSKLKN